MFELSRFCYACINFYMLFSGEEKEGKEIYLLINFHEREEFSFFFLNKGYRLTSVLVSAQVFVVVVRCVAIMTLFTISNLHYTLSI